VPENPSSPYSAAASQKIGGMPEQSVGTEVTVIAEVLDGQIIAPTRPSTEALAVKVVLGSELSRCLSGSAGRVGWSLFADPQLRLGQSVVVPDLAGWRKARLPRPPLDNRFTSVPDWVCEVLSPTTAVLDRTRKLSFYATKGVCWVWLIDPRHRTVEVLWLEGDEWVLAGAFGGDDRVHVSPFDGCELDLGVLWRAATDSASAPRP
jgi:Uma2 family endonuclease